MMLIFRYLRFISIERHGCTLYNRLISKLVQRLAIATCLGPADVNAAMCTSRDKMGMGESNRLQPITVSV